VCCPCAIQIRRFGQSYGLFLTTQGPESRSNPRTHREFETTRRARSDSFFLSRHAQPPLGTGKGTRARVVALHKCATRPATAAIDSVGPFPPTKTAKCILKPRRTN